MNFEDDIVSHYRGLFPANDLKRLAEASKLYRLIVKDHLALNPQIQTIRSMSNEISELQRQFTLIQPTFKLQHAVQSFIHAINVQNEAVAEAMQISTIGLYQKLINENRFEPIKPVVYSSFLQVSKAYYRIPNDDDSNEVPDTSSILYNEYEKVSLSIIAYSDFEKDEILDPSNIIFQDHTVERLNKNLGPKLAKLGNSFLNMWEGAIFALKSNSPDKIRQASTSVRALLTHFLDYVSPTENILSTFSIHDFKAFYTNNKNPTRKAKIAYCLKSKDAINFEKTDFLNKVASNINKLFDELNKGTHELDPNLEELKLRFVMFRVGSFINTICNV
ncbi:hypothetical protein CH370_19905 [Leptospira kmetyi]|uniref:pPIWI-associating nuclease domain-containing protein n=1 Tax=Leptospira kmetyi TaxID=408139 RepID=UPI000C29DA4E|nr:hypothetical protein [Leptospira kmetyi]PJZ39719.1 hypothetical protein CH370_19905 [Leptospira kmetyi]